MAVTRGAITSTVSATGVLSALVTVQVGSQVSGRVQAIEVDFNSVVEEGQVLARLDPQFFKAAIEQAEANLAAGIANAKRAAIRAEEARRALDRALALSRDALIAEADVDAARANAEVASADAEAASAAVRQDRAAVRQAHVNLGYTTIASPIRGIVISKQVDVGQTVAASFQAPTLFVIAEDLRNMQVQANVSEADVGLLSEGAEAEFTVDAFARKTFRGVLRQIRNSPETTQNVVTYSAIIDVANPALELRPGMTAAVTFVHATRSDVLRIPNAALRFTPSSVELGDAERATGGQSTDDATVWTLRGERPTPVTVRLGITDGAYTEVVSGELRADDRLIVGELARARGEPGSSPPHALAGGG